MQSMIKGQNTLLVMYLFIHILLHNSIQNSTHFCPAFAPASSHLWTLYENFFLTEPAKVPIFARIADSFGTVGERGESPSVRNGLG